MQSIIYTVFSSKRLLLLFLLIASIQASALQAVVTKNIFYAPVTNGIFKPYLEIYWQINPNSVLFKKENNAWQGKVRTDITIRDGHKVVNEEHYVLATKPVTEGSLLYAQNIIDLRRYELEPGIYYIELHFADDMKKENDYAYVDSVVVDSVGRRPRLSDIQLVDTSIVSEKEDIFQRNGNLQLPLCSNFFDEHRKTLHYYAELYRPQTETSPLTVRTFISKKEMEYAVNRLSKTDTAGGNIVTILENKFSLKTLPSGNYYLNVLVEDSNHEKLASKSLFFQLVNAHPEQMEAARPDSGNVNNHKDSYIDLNKTFVGKYKPEQVRAILKMIIPVADPTEKTNINAFLKRPDDTYSRYFIYNFWLKRNKLKPDEAWKEYASRVKEVNKLFGSSLFSGYETDRGIIYLKYGAPTERVVVNNESNALPYEIWQYNNLQNASNALFLFYRPGMVTNDYKLLHSTVTGEFKNKNWRSSLFEGGAAADAISSQAEQYVGNR